jgi:hypothetical protein
MEPIEPMYSVNDLVRMHGLSRRTIIRLYDEEKDIEPLTRVRNGRTRKTRRIPRRVYLRMVHRIKSGPAFC